MNKFTKIDNLSKEIISAMETESVSRICENCRNMEIIDENPAISKSDIHDLTFDDDENDDVPALIDCDDEMQDIIATTKRKEKDLIVFGDFRGPAVTQPNHSISLSQWIKKRIEQRIHLISK